MYIHMLINVLYYHIFILNKHKMFLMVFSIIFILLPQILPSPSLLGKTLCSIFSNFAIHSTCVLLCLSLELLLPTPLSLFNFLVSVFIPGYIPISKESELESKDEREHIEFTILGLGWLNNPA